MRKAFLLIMSFALAIALVMGLSSCELPNLGDGTGEKKEYTVTFIVDGEEYHKITVKEGENITLPEEPQKDAHSFTGWYVGEVKIDTEYKITGETVVTAGWREDETVHVHNLVHNIAVPATCTEDGTVEYWYCSGCDVYFSDENAATPLDSITVSSPGHNLTHSEPIAAGCTDGRAEYWYCDGCDKRFANEEATFEIFDIVVPATHFFTGNECTGCGKRVESSGLAYSLSNDKSFYIVSGRGACEDKNIIIPTTYEGKPVLQIKSYAFSNDTNLYSIQLHEGITYVVHSSFKGCDNLKYNEYDNGLYLGDGENDYFCLVKPKNTEVTSCKINSNTKLIGTQAFADCTNLRGIEIPDSAVVCGTARLFSNCNSLATVYLGASFKGYTTTMFSGCTSLTNVYISDKNQKYSSVAGVLYSKDGTTLIKYPPAKTAFEFDIPDGVQVIGEHAFNSCTSIVSITLPDSLIEIGDYAFSGCTGFMGMGAPKNLKTIGNRSFYGCTGIQYLKVPASVESIGTRAYGNCTNIDTVDVSEGVIAIGAYAFAGCTDLGEITIPSTVTSIGDSAFDECVSLCSITVSLNNTVYKTVDGDLYTKDGKTLIRYAIGKAATEFTLPDGVEIITLGAFADNTTLQSMTLPFVGESRDSEKCHIGHLFGAVAYSSDNVVPASLTTVTVTGSVGPYAFYRCPSLTHITVGNGIDDVSIGEYAFYCCRNLTVVDIKVGAKSIGICAFKECASITAINLPEGLSEIGNSTFALCTGLEEIILPTTLTKLGANAFNSCSGMKSIKIPGGVTDIQSGAFEDCTGLVSVEMENGVKRICEEAFRRCTSLKTVQLADTVCFVENDAFVGCTAIEYYDDGAFIYLGTAENNIHCLISAKKVKQSQVVPDGVKVISYGAFSGHNYVFTEITLPEGLLGICDKAFDGCTLLETLNMPNSVTEIGDYAFDNCKKLAVTSLPSSLTSIGMKAFYSCWKITTLDIPTNVTVIGYGAFEECLQLQKVTLSEGLVTIDKRAFYNCSKLSSINIPSTVTSIGEYAFYLCGNLISINIPEGITRIEKYTFYHCQEITTLRIPSSVTYIGEGAFLSCSKVSKIVIPAKVNYIGAKAFYGLRYTLEAEFENPLGWSITVSADTSREIDLTALSAKQVGTLLLDDYKDYVWNREQK